MAYYAPQDSTISKKPVSSKRGSVEKIKNAEQSFKKNDEQSTAKAYEDLAAEQAQLKNYTASNQYYEKAITIYDKYKGLNKSAELHRKIAYNNEQLRNLKAAEESYKASSRSAQTSELRNLNSYDLKRIESKGNQKVEESYLNKKIDELEASKDVDKNQEITQSKEQLAEIAVQADQPEKAIAILKSAAQNSNNPNSKLEINEKIADLYANNDSLDQAIEIIKSNLLIAKQNNDIELITDLQLKLAEYYYQSNDIGLATETLTKEYQTAYTQNNTISLIKLGESIIKYYKLNGDLKSAEQLNKELLEDILTLLPNDTLLFQSQLYTEIDKRLALLEQEKQIQTDLLKQTKNYNITLLLLLLLTLGTIIGIYWSLRKVKKKNLTISLQSLRREMNPHFIFNALNSVNQFIANNDERAANKYLSQYAALMRNFMNSSNSDFIALQDEIDSLKNYLALEHLRFANQFDYEIVIDEHLNTHQIQIPNMLLQPFLENAIWHGLRYKKEKGNLKLIIKQDGDYLTVQIIDNGIGIKASKAGKTKNQQTYVSRGMTNIKDRIENLNALHQTKIELNITELVTENQSGTIVNLKWKLIHEKIKH